MHLLCKFIFLNVYTKLVNEEEEEKEEAEEFIFH